LICMRWAGWAGGLILKITLRIGIFLGVFAI
jgi:hypothetical protein